MSPSGRFVAFRRPGGLELVDVLGTAARRTFSLGGGGGFALVGSTLVLFDAGAVTLVPLEGARAPAELAAGGAPGGALRGFWGRGADAALAGDALIAFNGPAATPCAPGAFPLLGRAVLVARDDRIAIAVPGRAATVDVALPGGGAVLDAAPVFGGRLFALVVRDGGGAAVVVLTAQGRLVHRVRLPAPGWHAFAIERGQLLAGTGDRELVAVDLRYGRIVAGATAPHAIHELAIDDDGRTAALTDASAEVPVITLLRTDELLRPRPAPAAIEDATAAAPPVCIEAAAPAWGVRAVAAPPAQDGPQPGAVASPAGRPASVALDDPLAGASAPGWSLAPEAPLAEESGAGAASPGLPALVPRALGEPTPSFLVDAPPGAAPFTGPAEHLAALIDLVAARAGLAIAEAWHTGRISGDALEHHPFQREVLALVGAGGSHAADQLIAARDRLLAQAEALSGRVLATLAAGRELPFVTLARELALSAMATQVAIAVAAPALRGEVGRLYRILANEGERAACDDALLATLLAGDDPALRDQLGGELAADGTLLRHGVLRRDPRGGLEVDEVVVARLRDRPVRCAPGTQLRGADRSLAELRVDRAALAHLVRELAEPRPPDAPVRVVLRGKPGAGGRAVIAALAAQVDRRIACIDARQLAGGGGPDALARELTRAALARAIPVVSGAERRQLGDPGLDDQRAVRHVLRCHPGPLILRTSGDAELPLDPGYVEVMLPPLGETEREQAFAAALAARGIAADAPRLAARYRIGPGTMVRVAAQVRRTLDRTGGEPTAVVDEATRQHVAARIGAAAQRVTRLATWDQVALPEDMLDSLRELIGRARHTRTVFDTWGYDRRISTARGITALFYGPPGTGKTMIAGLIARELGLELYRVDLARVMSKWVGETEKNLGEVFDAAEDGRLMLLFDEADSLFARRSEVRTSNDRYANLEVNYLLQRLDAFEGVAVLTTNLEGSIDPAFKRRLAMRMYFPFPDEELRAQLWASHVPPQVPTAGPLDFAALARRFPLSGGYIRNSALRAAFLAAQENVAVSQAHLERAVLLEYRELGKLADDGRME